MSEINTPHLWWEANQIIYKPNPDIKIESGIKHDQDKPRYDLLAPELLEEVSKVLTFGANKYGDRNWELGMDWHRPFGALMRHMWSWWRGEELDVESGLSHLSHAACNLMFLLAYSKREIGKDTRTVR